MKTKIPFLIFLLLFIGKTIHAQNSEAEAILMRSQIKIGEQVDLKLAVRYHEGTKKSVVTWPELKDTLSKEIEIIKMDSIKTVLASRSSVLYEQARTITITAFDSGTYIIPSQIFIVNKDTIYTNELKLYVNTIPVDTTKPIKDIKSIYDVPGAPIVDEPKTSNQWMWFALGGLLVITAVFLIIYFTRKKKLIPMIHSPQRELLPHEKVLEQLAELGRNKPWLHGELKQYHISMTEILRAWVVERFRIHAKEMTTGEIIYLLNSNRADASASMKLERVLRTADMVKFAKGIPENEENEYCLQLAMDFVSATAIYPEPSIPQIQ
jgi:LPXTG-motif cell wall-anchored protein